MLEQRRQEAIATDPDDADVLLQCAADSPGVRAPVASAALARPSTAAPCSAVPRLWRTPAALPKRTKSPVRPGFPPSTISPPRQPSCAAGRALPAPTTSGRGSSGLPGLIDPSAPLARLPASTAPTTPRPRHGWQLKRDDPQAEPLVAALPTDHADEPGLMLDRARALRREDRSAARSRYGCGSATAAQHAAPTNLGRVLDRAEPAGAKVAARWRRQGRRYDAIRRRRHGRIRRRAACSTPSSWPASSPLRLLHDPSGGEAAFQGARRLSPPPSHRAARTTGSARTAAAAGATRSRNTQVPPPGRRPSMASSPRWRWANDRFGGGRGTSPRCIDPAWTRVTRHWPFTGHEVVRAAAMAGRLGRPAAGAQLPDAHGRASRRSRPNAR